MRTPVEALAASDEYIVDKTVYDKAKGGRRLVAEKWDTFDFTQTSSISVNPLAERIKMWLAGNSFPTAHADWLSDPVLRMKVYGEFQQHMNPGTPFDQLTYADPTTKQKAELCFCLVLDQDFLQPSPTFVERIDQVNRALKLGFPQSTHPALESRWPRVFREPVVQLCIRRSDDEGIGRPHGEGC